MAGPHGHDPAGYRCPFCRVVALPALRGRRPVPAPEAVHRPGRAPAVRREAAGAPGHRAL